MSATDQFTEHPVLTAIAIGYRNEDQVLVADEVLPRIKASQRFSWQSYNEAEDFTVPNTRVGRRGTPPVVEIEGKELESATEDFGVDVPLDDATIKAAEANGWNPRNRATERATGIVMLDREIRVAKLITDPTQYHADNVLALAAGDKFTNADSNPIKTLEDWMDQFWQRPNQVTFGLPAWRALRSHPKVVKAVHGNSGDEGRASREAVAELLEVQRVIVGAARHNLNRPGAPAQVTRTWGATVSAQYIDRSADTSGGITFGFTAQYGEKIAGTMPANFGLRGGELVRSGESVKELIVANRAGGLIQGAV